MPISLIVGPPNSGRAGEIRRRFSDAAGRDPVLVVPTREDAERFERELCAGDGASLGGAVLTFGWLFGEVARATGAASPPLLTATQRLQLVRAAIRRTSLGALRRSASRAGFAPALEALFGELQSAGIDPDGLARTVAERGGERIEAELSELFRAYRTLCRELGMADSHDLAAAAIATLRRYPDAWGGRPLYLYGFDDLTAQQLELLRALGEATEVCIAVTWEDRAALLARAGLLAELRDRLGARIELELGPQPGYTRSPILHHLERHLFEPAPPRLEPDRGLGLLEAAGSRAEAELIGGRIARLLADGVPPGEIAIVVRHPDADGPLLAEVLGRLGIPVAADARQPFERTAVGRGLLALLRAAYGSRGAADLLAFLRVPGRARPSDVDWLERAIRRRRLDSAGEALTEWRRRDRRRLWELDALREARSDPERLLVIARIATEIAERPLLHKAIVPAPDWRLELRAAAAARSALEELAALGRHAPGPEEAIVALQSLAISLGEGAAGERVRIVSPYRVRAGRFRQLFVAALQDGVFPSHGSEEPLIGEERREALGLPARRAPADEERYLFYACLSRPTEVLHLSFRSVDEEGQAALPSPFLEDVRDLLAPAPSDGRDGVVEELTTTRGLGEVAFPPAGAPNERELQRAIVALPPAIVEEAVESLALPAEIAAAARAARGRAEELTQPLPGPLRAPAVRAELGERRLFGASTLEEYLVCSYRWFVQHELRPESIEPRPEGMTQGGIVHEALERLYAERPEGSALPRPDNLAAWRRRASELLVEVARERGIDASRGASARVSVARMIALVERFLATEARSEIPLRPAPDLLEASFGEAEEDSRPALELGELALHGKIDRIDVSGGERRAALIRDYKLAAQVPPGANLEKEGRLQLPLYALAARELWDLDPIGAVYQPLGARKDKDTRPRGLLAEHERDALLPSREFVRPDFVPAAGLDEALESARARAAEVAGRMRAGVIARDPREGRCPSWCTFQPICRLERAASLDAEPEEEAGS